MGADAADHQIRLRSEGVDAAFAVWVNGIDVGSSQGSQNPSESDITNLVKSSGESNVFAVQVYQRCDGSYIEDQDQWWLSGIFCDVYLLYCPEPHFHDFTLQTELGTDDTPRVVNID